MFIIEMFIFIISLYNHDCATSRLYVVGSALPGRAA